MQGLQQRQQQSIESGTPGKAPLTSVIMPCFGMGNFIGQALESVASQSLQSWEIIAVDDCGPDDGTHETVSKFAEQQIEHRVEWIRHKKNMGVSAARNTAIEAAKGEFIAFLDPDDYWLPGHLEKSIAEFNQAPHATVVTSMVRMVDNTKESEQEYGPTKFDRDWFPASLALRNFIQPSATLIKRDALATVGKFDTTPQMQHVEDWDLWIKLAVHKCEFVFRQDADSMYRTHATAATSNEAAMHDRISFLMSKHLSFFNTHMSSLMHELVRRADYSEFDTATKLDLVNQKVDGPLMQAIRFADRGLSRIAKLFSSPGHNK